MNTRQKDFLKLMVKQDGYISTKQVAKCINCSERTVRNDMKAINSCLVKIVPSVQITSKQGNGLILKCTTQDKQQIQAYLEVDKVDNSESLHRFYNGMLLTALYPNTYTLDSLCKKLFCSKQQLQKDIRRINELLVPYQSQVVVSKYINLEGPEINIRFFIVYFFYEFADEAMKEKIEPIVFGDKKAKLFQLLKELECNTQRSYSLNTKHQTMLYIEIAMRRISKGQVLPKTHNVKLCEGILVLVERLEDLYGVVIEASEAILLQEIFLVSNRGFVNQTYATEQITPRAKAYTNTLVEQINLLLMCTKDMNQTQKTELTKLINAGLIRHSHKLNSVVSPKVKWSVRWDNMECCMFLYPALLKSACIQNTVLYTTDYTRICLMLTPYINTYFKPNRWTVGLVINGGAEQANFLKETLMLMCPSFDIPLILDSYETKKAIAKSGLQAIDFFVGFETVDINKPYLRLTESLDITDKINLFKFLEELEYPNRSNDNFKLKCISNLGLSVTRPKSLFHDLYDLLVEQGVWTESYKLFETASQIGSFSQNDWMVITITHESISGTLAYILDTQGYMLVTGMNIEHLAILLVSPNDITHTQSICKQFKKLLTDKGLNQKLIDTDVL